MTRRSFLVRLAALIAAPAALVVGRREPDYSRIAWSAIPVGPEHVLGAFVHRRHRGTGRVESRWFTREEWLKLQDRRAKRV